ncbi:pyrroline-5-carboxylate reductase [Caproiciproducens sp.]
MLDKKVIFIGGGNMAEGIIRGQINNGAIDAGNIFVYDVIPERVEYLENTYKINGASDMKSAVEKADIVFMAVRPQHADGVLQDIRKWLNSNTLVVSICAGITLDKIQNMLGEKSRIARIMPNVLIEAQHGYSGVCVNSKVNDEDKKAIECMLNALGQTLFISESLFDEFTAFSCAGPAYVLYFLTALIDAGVQSGFSRSDARNMAVENLIGSALMTQKTGKHPYQITDTMTSPAGVTIDGLKVLSETGMHGIVMECVKQAVKRAHELS